MTPLSLRMKNNKYGLLFVYVYGKKKWKKEPYKFEFSGENKGVSKK